jgi:hypothetical protein
MIKKVEFLTNEITNLRKEHAKEVQVLKAENQEFRNEIKALCEENTT